MPSEAMREGSLRSTLTAEANNYKSKAWWKQGEQSPRRDRGLPAVRGPWLPHPLPCPQQNLTLGASTSSGGYFWPVGRGAQSWLWSGVLPCRSLQDPTLTQRRPLWGQCPRWHWLRAKHPKMGQVQSNGGQKTPQRPTRDPVLQYDSMPLRH